MRTVCQRRCRLFDVLSRPCVRPLSEVNVSRQWWTVKSKREYAQPANLGIQPVKIAFKPPPAPAKPTEPTTVEHGHEPGQAGHAAGPFDDFLADTAQVLRSSSVTSVSTLYSQYQEKAGRMCNYVVTYEENPPPSRRADVSPGGNSEAGDGLVMVVHALFKSDGRLDKICACSGFVVDAKPVDKGKDNGEVIITCAHTLEEMYRNIRQVDNVDKRTSMTFVIPASGKARRVHQVLSSMPRSDAVAMQVEPDSVRWDSLPVSPFPVFSGMTVLTHLFGTPNAPTVVRSQSRLPSSAKDYPDITSTEEPIKWLSDHAWRRWGGGNMLGYRSYTNIEVEAGIHSSLPHILTSILPSPGSSGGPLVSAATGSVVGMISGRRMDNRVEGERGWGASSESIFEMFSLPGFMPTSSSS